MLSRYLPARYRTHEGVRILRQQAASGQTGLCLSDGCKSMPKTCGKDRNDPVIPDILRHRVQIFLVIHHLIRQTKRIRQFRLPVRNVPAGGTAGPAAVLATSASDTDRACHRVGAPPRPAIGRRPRQPHEKNQADSLTIMQNARLESGRFPRPTQDTKDQTADTERSAAVLFAATKPFPEQIRKRGIAPQQVTADLHWHPTMHAGLFQQQTGEGTPPLTPPAGRRWRGPGRSRRRCGMFGRRWPAV